MGKKRDLEEDFIHRLFLSHPLSVPSHLLSGSDKNYLRTDNPIEESSPFVIYAIRGPVFGEN